jgi:hypothetical protein
MSWDQPSFLECLNNICVVRGVLVGSRLQFEAMVSTISHPIPLGLAMVQISAISFPSIRKKFGDSNLAELHNEFCGATGILLPYGEMGFSADNGTQNRAIEANKIKPVVDQKVFTPDQTKEQIVPGVRKGETMLTKLQCLPIHVGSEALWQAYHQDLLNKNS